MNLRVLLVTATCLAATAAFSQKQANWWYFGSAAGLDFSGGAPVSTTPSSINTSEGCATVSDTAGNLKFYTDGIRVWDRNHNQMPNGNGMLGNSSSTQSGIAIPDPGNADQYYIFACAQLAQASGVTYSIVDMTLNGGLGDVTTKNVPMLTPTCEKLTAVSHANGRDIWVLTHKWRSDEFYAWLVTPTGIQPPVITAVGSYNGGSSQSTLGYLRASSKGDRLALSMYTADTLEIYNFDNATGIPSNPIVIAGVANGGYGIEFSSSGQFLYVGEAVPGTELLQFDLTSGTAAGIAASRQVLRNAGGSPGAVQMGPDGVIYATQYGANAIDAINDPEVAFPGCNFVQGQVSLGNGACRYGLPNFITSFFNPAVFDVAPVCTGDTVQLENFNANLQPGQKYFWDLGDGRIDTALNPNIIYHTPGTYTLSFIRYGSADDTTIETVEVIQMPTAELGNDTGVCEGHELNVSMADTIRWSTGDSVPTIEVNQTGLYYVTVKNQFCVATDTIDISVLPNPTAYAGDDSLVVCKGDSVPLGGQPPASGGLPPYDYSWTPTTGLNNHLIPHPNARPSQETDYILVVQDANGCIGADIVKVRVALTVEADAGPNILACEGSYAKIGGAPSATGGSAPYSYSWAPVAPLNNTILSNPDALVQGTQTFILTVTDARGCVDFDTMVLRGSPLPIVDAGDDIHACPGKDVFLGGSPVAGGGIAPYSIEWFVAGGGSYANVANPGLTIGASQQYHVAVTDSLGCVGRDTQSVVAFPAPVAAFSATQAGMTQYFTDLSSGAISWDWDFGDGSYGQQQHPNKTYNFQQPYVVTLTVTSQHGCTHTTTDSLSWATSSVEATGQSWTLWPNPADHYVMLEAMHLQDEIKLELRDINGRTLRVVRIEDRQTRIDVSDLPSGIYVLHAPGLHYKLLIR